MIAKETCATMLGERCRCIVGRHMLVRPVLPSVSILPTGDDFSQPKILEVPAIWSHEYAGEKR